LFQGGYFPRQTVPLNGYPRMRQFFDGRKRQKFGDLNIFMGSFPELHQFMPRYLDVSENNGTPPNHPF